jgi:hypothetical protein
MADATASKKGEGTFNRTRSALGTLVGAFSIFALIAKTWERGLAVPIELLIDAYNGFLNFFLGWAQPYLQEFAETLSTWTGFDLHLYPHWKASVVAYGILVGAGVSSWAEAKFPSVPQLAISVVAGAAGVAVGLLDAMLQRDLQPGDQFYALWQMIGQSYLFVLTFIIASTLAIAGLVLRRGERSFMSVADAELCLDVGKRTLAMYAGAAVFALCAVAGKLLPI